MSKMHKAKDVVQDRGDGEFWLDHAKVAEDDIEWLASAERLTLWNVKLPDGFLAKLPRLWFVDLRGGTATDLAAAAGCKGLRYLAVNQLRGMRDLSVIGELKSLQLLSLYGLAKVTELPSLRAQKKLLRLEVGQMRGLATLGAALDAGKLEELYLQKKVGITDRDVKRINKHKALKRFAWHAEDVPLKVSRPVQQSIALPPARAMHGIDWFKARGLA